MSSATSPRLLTAGMIRGAKRVAPVARPELPQFLDAAAASLGKLLSGYTQAPLRCESDGLRVASRELPIASAEVVHVTSPRGGLSVHLLADRRFVMGLCEASFGGGGTEEPHDEAERPLSRTESRLSAIVLKELAGQLPRLMSDCFETQFNLAEVDPKRRPPQAAPADVIDLRILVHIFGYSGEILLLVPEDGLAALTSAAVGSQSPDGTDHHTQYKQAVFTSDIQLDAMLPQDLMPLGAVVNLRKGQLLKLSATALTPVLLASDGVTLQRARLGAGGGRVQLEILDP